MAKTTTDDGQKRVKVTVIAGKRENFSGWWAAGRQWKEGQTVAELTPEEVANVASRPGLVVLDEQNRQITASAPVSAPMQHLTQDEAKALDEYRAARAKDPKLAERYAPNAKPYEVGEKLSTAEALEQTLAAPAAEPATAPDTSVISHTPLETRTEVRDTSLSTRDSDKDKRKR